MITTRHASTRAGGTMSIPSAESLRTGALSGRRSSELPRHQAGAPDEGRRPAPALPLQRPPGGPPGPRAGAHARRARRERAAQGVAPGQRLRPLLPDGEASARGVRGGRTRPAFEDAARPGRALRRLPRVPLPIPSRSRAPIPTPSRRSESRRASRSRAPSPLYLRNLKSATCAALPSLSFNSKRRQEPDHAFSVFQV